MKIYFLRDARTPASLLGRKLLYICFQKKLKSREVQRSVLFQEETQRKNSAKCISVNMRVVKLESRVCGYFLGRPKFPAATQAGFISRVRCELWPTCVCAPSAYAWTAHAPPPSAFHKTLRHIWKCGVNFNESQKQDVRKTLITALFPSLPWGCECERALFGWRGRPVEFQPFTQ